MEKPPTRTEYFYPAQQVIHTHTHTWCAHCMHNDWLVPPPSLVCMACPHPLATWVGIWPLRPWVLAPCTLPLQDTSTLRVRMINIIINHSSKCLYITGAPPMEPVPMTSSDGISDNPDNYIPDVVKGFIPFFHTQVIEKVRTTQKLLPLQYSPIRTEYRWNSSYIWRWVRETIYSFLHGGSLAPGRTHSPPRQRRCVSTVVHLFSV